MSDQQSYTKTALLNLREELILLLLNDETGYFHQVQGWNLNCAVIGAALAELALDLRIDTDTDALYLVNKAETGDPVLDSILATIAAEPTQNHTQYWIERLTPRAESIIDSTLEQLAERGILHHQSGGFWSLSRAAWQTQTAGSSDDREVEFVKIRIGKVIFDDEFPDPRDIIIICLVNTCDVFRFIFPLDEPSMERIRLISRMDVIGRSIATAIDQSLSGPALRRPQRTKPIPSVPLREFLVNRHARVGNIPALFADLASRHGPVFKLRVPFPRGGMIVLAGARTNEWVHRSGRLYLRAKDYLEDFQKVYGASRILPSMDGAEHFRMRKAMSPTCSREALEGQLGELYRHARAYMATWKVGDTLPAVTTFQELMNAQYSPLAVGVDTQDSIKNLLEFKQRSLTTHILKALPKFFLHTPGMKRRKKEIGNLLDRIQAVHTPAQRVGCPRDVIDDLLSLHDSDPQFLPETDLHFALVAPLIVSVYLGNAMSFAVYAMVSQPSLYKRIRSEADALFAGGDPGPKELSKAAINVTHRFLLESQRMYPILPLQIRTVMNGCVVEGHELETGTRIYIMHTAAHYMKDVFPDPFSFDIDRYLPPREEQRGFGYAPFGLGTHLCLGHRWVELQMAVNLLMIAHYFTLDLKSKRYKLRINPFPTMAPSRKLKFVVSEQRHQLDA